MKKGTVTKDFYVVSPDGENVYVYEGKDDSGELILTGTIQEDGSIKWDDLNQPIMIDNIIITLENGTEPADYSQEIGTPLVINFDTSIKDGQITNIEPNLPYKTTGTEMEKTFTVIGKADGMVYSKTVTVELSKKYKIKEPQIRASITDWTNENVIVEVDYGVLDASYIKEISIDNGQNYQTYTGSVAVEKNTIVKARIRGEVVVESELEITNIDKIAPKVFMPTVLENVSSTELTINAETTDGEATEEYGQSGMKEYQYFVYQGETMIDRSEIIENNSWKASGLIVGEVYDIYIEAYDKAGNKVESEVMKDYRKLEVYVWEKFVASIYNYYSYTDTTGLAMSFSGGWSGATYGSYNGPLDDKTGLWTKTHDVNII